MFHVVFAALQAFVAVLQLSVTHQCIMWLAMDASNLSALHYVAAVAVCRVVLIAMITYATDATIMLAVMWRGAHLVCSLLGWEHAVGCPSRSQALCVGQHGALIIILCAVMLAATLHLAGTLTQAPNKGQSHGLAMTVI